MYEKKFSSLHIIGRPNACDKGRIMRRILEEYTQKVNPKELLHKGIMSELLTQKGELWEELTRILS